MGAENSTRNTQNKREDPTDRMVAEALEKQKRLYEEKYEELRRAQTQKLKAVIRLQKESVIISNGFNGNQTANNVNQQPATHVSAPLYPNLNITNNNNAQMSTAYASPSTSHIQSPSNTILSSGLPTAPSAPLQPAFEALSVASTCSINQLRSQPHVHHGFSSAHLPVPSAPIAPASDTRSATTAQYFATPRPQPQAHPGLSQLQTQRPIAQMTKAVPSTSSASSQTMNLPVPPQSKPKDRNDPRYKATPSIVECVTCSNELGFQIYQCKNGHSSCKECRLKQHRCGRCHEIVTDMRNITLETTIADLKLKQMNDGERMKCPNAVDGCCLSFKKNEIEDHLKECPYREMACPLTAIFGICTWKGKINQIGMHFKEMHQEHYEADVDKEMYLLNINANHRIVHLVTLGAFNFLIHFEIDSNQKTICMTIQMLGTKFSASKWTYELHVYNKREPRRKYQYIDTCISNSESIKEIFMQKKCAVLASEYAKTFLDNNKLSYKFYIKKNLNIKKNQQK